METPIMETATMQHLPTISMVMHRKILCFGVLGLILGIAALPFGWFVPIIGIILGIAAIILSILEWVRTVTFVVQQLPD